MLGFMAIIFGAIYVDQLTKWLAVIYLEGQPPFPIIKDVFQLNYAENTGAAFSMLEDKPWIFVPISFVAIIGLFIYLIKFVSPRDKITGIGLSMIIGGGIGNMIDRLMQGYVVDFFDFVLIRFAIFNVADSFVCVGAGLVILSLVISMVKDIKDAKKTANNCK